MSVPKAALVAGAVAVLAGTFAAGRYSRPAEVRETTKIETRWRVHITWFWRETRAEIKRERRNVRVVRVETPSGIATTTTEDRTETDTDTTVVARAGGDGEASGMATAETSKSTTVTRPEWAVQAGWRLLPGASAVPSDAEIQRRILGPAWIGIGATQDDGRWGVRGSIRVEF